MMTIEQLSTSLETAGYTSDQMRKLLQDIGKLDAERAANLPKIRRQVARLDTLLNQTDAQQAQPVHDHLEQYKQDLVACEEHIRQRFGVDLEQALQPLGLSLSGTYPELKAGLFLLKLNFDKDRVTIWYGSEQERLGECRLLAADVAKRLEQALASLGSGLDAEPFLKTLQHAYQRTCHRLDIAAGERAPINAVLPEVAFLVQHDAFLRNPVREQYRSYSRADFSYDLYRFRQTLVAAGLKLTVAVRAYTRDRKDFLWIPDNEHGQGTTYSHLHMEQEPA
jgi:hypothetical protein